MWHFGRKNHSKSLAQAEFSMRIFCFLLSKQAFQRGILREKFCSEMLRLPDEHFAIAEGYLNREQGISTCRGIYNHINSLRPLSDLSLMQAGSFKHQQTQRLDLKI